jgi:alanine racemase
MPYKYSMTQTAAAILDIDLDALAANISVLQNKAGPAVSVAGIVKADAYGIGMEQVAAVHRALGTRIFFVATLDEGIALRGMTGPGYEIAVLAGLFPGVEDEYARHGLTPVLNTLEEAARWARPDPVMIHIDTGMRRLGLDARDMQKLMEAPDLLKGLNVAAVISHFACADEPGHPLTREQFEKFSAVSLLFPGIRKSLSNSAGIFVSPAYHFDMVRPGMAVYGLNPTPGRPSPVKPVVQLRTRVLQVRQVEKGDSVGYGASWKAGSPRRIATVALGYADGFLRSLSNRGTLFWSGQPCPVAGRVSMDLVTVDVTDVPALKTGDWMDVLGPSQDADALAEAAGTIGYEILTGLGNRYRRIYKGSRL